MNEMTDPDRETLGEITDCHQWAGGGKEFGGGGRHQILYAGKTLYIISDYMCDNFAACFGDEIEHFNFNI